MQRSAAIILLSVCVCSGQWSFNDPAFVAQQYTAPAGDSFYPTNITGYPAVAYWVADDITGTPATWASRKGTFPLTMIGSPAVTSAGLNGHNYVRFNGSSQKATNLTVSVAQQLEVAMVSTLVVPSAASQFMFDSGSASPRMYGAISTTPYERINAGTSLSTTTIFPTNKWLVRNYVYNGASSGIYTNRTAFITGAAGANALSGFIVGGNYLGTVWANIGVAEVVIYSTNLTATIRSNLFAYWTNKYNLTP